MNKETFIAYLSKKNRRPQSHYREALAEILEGIQDQLKAKKHIRFIGFGTFYTRVRKATTGRNIKTKQKIQIPEMRQAAFQVGAVLRKAVRGKQKPEGKKKKGLFGRKK
jgi:DNA-binding protein HU-beta